MKAKPKVRPKPKATRPPLAERLATGLDDVRRFLEGEKGTGVKVYRVKLPPHVAAVRELVAAREEAGMSVADVAAAIGVSADAVKKLEAGKVKRPTVAVLEGYAQAVGKELRLAVVSPAKAK